MKRRVRERAVTSLGRALIGRIGDSICFFTNNPSNRSSVLQRHPTPSPPPLSQLFTVLRKRERPNNDPVNRPYSSLAPSLGGRACTLRGSAPSLRLFHHPPSRTPQIRTSIFPRCVCCLIVLFFSIYRGCHAVRE